MTTSYSFAINGDVTMRREAILKGFESISRIADVTFYESAPEQAVFRVVDLSQGLAAFHVNTPTRPIGYNVTLTDDAGNTHVSYVMVEAHPDDEWIAWHEIGHGLIRNGVGLLDRPNDDPRQTGYSYRPLPDGSRPRRPQADDIELLQRLWGASPRSDLIYGGDGSGPIKGGRGFDTIHGQGGDDVLYGNQENDILFGGDGRDTLYGGQDHDSVSGGAGADVLYGNLGADTMVGGEGDDTLYGGQDRDVLFGGAGRNILYGNRGDDVLHADHDDTVYGGPGADTVYGGNYFPDYNPAEGDVWKR